MAPIDDAIAAIEAHEPGEQFSCRAIAKQFGVSRATLSRRHQGVTESRAAAAQRRQLLNPQQEAELVKYIERLTEQGLPPTREMVSNFAGCVGDWDGSDAWVSRFLHRHHVDLTVKWSAGIDRCRHQADSYKKYDLYFHLLHSKMREYNILPRNTYNMDEKGFFVGITARSKRVFSKAIWLQQLRTAAIQDGNREWITLVACVCGDGTSLPPMLIYEGKAGIQSSWVDALDEDLHRAFVTNSPTGWSNNELGLAWLTEVFERYTHEKARRQWRLLILDGHGSHLTREFIEYCDSKKILLAVYPPHSTHTLQPLDVVMFSPLAKAYSQELDRHLHRSQGLIAVKKRDFFPIFWPAWSYTMRPELILQSFRATGVWPMDAQVILDRFNTPPSEQAIHPGLREVGDGDTWRDIRKILDAAVTERAKVEGNRVGTALHSLQAQNELLHHENDGLHEALLTKQRHKKKNSLLGLEDGSGALLFSPRKVQQARQQLLDKQHQEEEERLQKARRKEERAAAIARKKLEQEAAKARRKVEMERRKEEREAKAAQLAAARALKNQQREAATSQKSRDTPNKGKRKASQKAAPKTTKKRRVMGVRSGVDVASPLPEPPTKTS